jgi:hypothetical protein
MLKYFLIVLIYLNCYLIPYLKNYRKNYNGDIVILTILWINKVARSRILQSSRMSLV